MQALRRPVPTTKTHRQPGLPKVLTSCRALLLGGALLSSAVLSSACEATSSEPGVRHGGLQAKSASARLPAPLASSSGSVQAAPVALPPPSADPRGPRPSPGVKLTGGGSQAVSGRQGLVTSVEAEATRAGVRMLEQGGNAVDAAVAVAFALSVTHPSAASLGGGGFMLIAQPKAVHALDFRETAPLNLPRARFDKMIEARGRGAAAVGVPGLVAGMSKAHERFGRLQWRAVLAPAIDLASKGYRLGSRQHLSLTWNWRHLREQAAFVSRFAGPGGRSPAAAGSKLTRPDLAKTLRLIAERGGSAFYAEPLARQLIADLGDDGLLTLRDFQRYRAKWREPLVVSYRGLGVVTMPPPSAGGVALVQTLLMLASLKAHELSHNSPQALHVLAEAARRAHAERRFHVIDPDALTLAEAERRRARWLNPRVLSGAHPIDPNRATSSSQIHPLFSEATESEHTTHFSVVDRDGMAVSCTITLSAGFGAKLMSSSTGLVLNNSVASFSTEGENLPVGGRRTTSSMAPSVIYFGDRLGLVLGSPGGDTIPNTVVQVLRNVVDYGMTIDKAVVAPRIHHGFIPDAIRYERGRAIPMATRRALQKLGHRFSKNTTPIGDANNILIAGEVAFGIADPREGGLALAAKPPASAASEPHTGQP